MMHISSRRKQKC